MVAKSCFLLNEKNSKQREHIVLQSKDQMHVQYTILDTYCKKEHVTHIVCVRSASVSFTYLRAVLYKDFEFQ